MRCFENTAMARATWFIHRMIHRYGGQAQQATNTVLDSMSKMNWITSFLRLEMEKQHED